MRSKSIDFDQTDAVRHTIAPPANVTTSALIERSRLTHLGPFR